MVQGSKTNARARARQAQGDLLAARAEHDRQVLAATEAWYEATDAREAAEAAVAAATDQQSKAVGQLIELKVSVEDVAALCGISVGDVRVLSRRKSDEQQPS